MINEFLLKVNNLILNPLILLAFAVALMYFLYGIVKFLSQDAVDKTREQSKQAVFYGLVGMLVMFSVYGLIHFVLGTFGISENDPSLETAKPYIKLGQ